MPIHLDSGFWMLDVRKAPIIYNLKSKIWRPRRPGFTLIELLVVISIIGILIAAAAVSYTNAQQKGRDGKRKSDLKTIQQALALYFEANGKYPDSGTDTDLGKIKCNVGSADPLTWGTSPFACNLINYLTQLPKDPINQSTTGYYFFSPNPPNSYVISADLENNSDPDRNGLPCAHYTGPPARDYCVANP